MNEFSPTPEETGAEDWKEPSNLVPPELELVEYQGMTESEAMNAIRTQVEQTGTITPESASAYQDMARELAETFPDQALGRLEADFLLATLKAAAGMREDAVEDLEILTMTPEMDEYPEFAKRVRSTLNSL